MSHLQPAALTRALASVGFVCAMTACGDVVAATKSPSDGAVPESTISNADLWKKLDALAAQNTALQERIATLEATQAQQSRQMQRQEALVEQQHGRVQDVDPKIENKTETSIPSTTVVGYGEIGYTHPTKSAQNTNVDVQRAVIGLNHRFDDKTKMVSEFEWEHAITSSSDRGEAEVEQLWLEREFQPDLRGRAGLFLMPVGLVNQNHEPTAYYGVYRPDVDTKIIPSTWREVGLGLSGDTAVGVNWDVALTTAPNLSKWDPTSTEGQVRGPLQAVHGEGQFAAARDLGVVSAINWRGVPGLLVGGSVVYDSIGQHQSNMLGNSSKLLMLDLHARYQANGWDLAGEFIRSTISHTEGLNTSFAAATLNATLVPHLFYGGYLQAAYKLWEWEDYAFTPFARYEVLNTAADFGSLPVAVSGATRPDNKIWTFGVNLAIGEGIVLKADYRNNSQNKLPDPVNHFNLGNSLNFGIGFSY